MKRTVLTIGILIFLTGALFPDTMMVAVFYEQENGPAAETKNTLAFALEGGVMDHLFEQGHIVFNAGQRENNSINSRSNSDNTIPLYLAKSGGAGFLLNIYLDYLDIGNEKPKWEVSSARYSLMNVYTNEILAEGKIKMRNPYEEEKSAERQSFELGKRLAQEVLSGRKAVLQ